jgi:hypothetical protein
MVLLGKLNAARLSHVAAAAACATRQPKTVNIATTNNSPANLAIAGSLASWAGFMFILLASG